MVWSITYHILGSDSGSSTYHLCIISKIDYKIHPPKLVRITGSEKDDDVTNDGSDSQDQDSVIEQILTIMHLHVYRTDNAFDHKCIFI